MVGKTEGLRRAREEKRRSHPSRGIRQGIAKFSQLIQIHEGKIQEHLRGVFRSVVEEMLNALLDAEADRLCRPKGTSAPRAARIPGRVPTNGSCTPTSGESAQSSTF